MARSKLTPLSGWRTVLLIAPLILLSGCTTALWDKNTFAHYCRPANQSNLHLFYSSERQDVLVQYDERKDTDDQIRSRCYWLEFDNPRVDQAQAPHFVPVKRTDGLAAIPVGTSTNPPAASLSGLHAVAGRDADEFTLYSGQEQLRRCRLPAYVDTGAQTVKKVFLTPLAVAVDATIVGAVIAYFSAPSLLPGLTR